jgi:hypothetical protein
MYTYPAIKRVGRENRYPARSHGKGKLETLGGCNQSKTASKRKENKTTGTRRKLAEPFAPKKPWLAAHGGRLATASKSSEKIDGPI